MERDVSDRLTVLGNALADLAGRVAYLEYQQDVQKHVVQALMQMVPSDKKLLMQQLIEATQAFADAKGEEQLARGIGNFANEAGAMGDTPELSVSNSLGLAEFLRSVPAEQKEPMLTWLTCATPEEIFDEIAQSRRSQSAGSSAPTGDNSGADEKTDKE